jgi:hypothetical protein
VIPGGRSSSSNGGTEPLPRLKARGSGWLELAIAIAAFSSKKIGTDLSKEIHVGQESMSSKIESAIQKLLDDPTKQSTDIAQWGLAHALKNIVKRFKETHSSFESHACFSSILFFKSFIELLQKGCPTSAGSSLSSSLEKIFPQLKKIQSSRMTWS